MSAEYPVAISIRGPVGSGKSTLAATWAGNKFWYDLEQGAIRAMNQIPNWQQTNYLWHPNHEFPDDMMRKIAIAQLTMSAMGRIQGYIPVWEEIVERLVDVAITGKFTNNEVMFDNIQVNVIDTWKIIWSTNCQAHLQFMQENPSKAEKERDDFHKRLTEKDFGTPNARMMSLIQSVKGLRRDLILISHETDIYGPSFDARGNPKDDQPTGEMKLDGWKYTKAESDWAFITSKEAPCKQKHRSSKAAKECKKFHFHAVIEKSPVGAELEGIDIIDPSYDKLKTMIEKMGKELII